MFGKGLNAALLKLRCIMQAFRWWIRNKSESRWMLEVLTSSSHILMLLHGVFTVTQFLLVLVQHECTALLQ